MKKILFLIMISTLAFAYTGVEKTTNGLTQYQKKNIDLKQKPQTSADFQNMLTTLKNAYALGDKSKAYVIGNIYIQEHKLLDTVLSPDENEAIKWFKRGLDAGYGLNALSFALLYYLPKKEFYNTLDILEQGIQSKFIDFSGQASLSIAYASIVLDYLHGDKKYIKKAIDLIYPVVSKEAISSLDYVFANLLNLDNQPELANKYLNSACNNPKVPAEVWDICIRGKEINALNKKTGQVVGKNKETNCPISKLMPGYN